MLFTVTKYQPAAAPPYSNAGIPDDGQQVATVSQKLEEVVNLTDHGRSVHYVSNGDWSMHQLLERLLLKTGPADVWISSYAFSETPARIIADRVSQGMIKQLNCVLDSRIDVRSASALTIIRNSAKSFKLCNTHAKVTVLQNPDWFLCVTGSANYTINKRYEAGLISCNAIVAGFHKTWIEHELTRIG